MGKASRQLDTHRATRNRVRRRFDLRLAKARQDLAPGALAARVTGEIGRQAHDAFDEAVEIADENRAVVAGSIAALVIWILRKPILAWLGGKADDSGQEEDIADDES